MFPFIRCQPGASEERCALFNPTDPRQPEQINKHCFLLNEVPDLHQNQRSFTKLYWGRLMAHILGLWWGKLPTAVLCILLPTPMPATPEKNTNISCGCAFKAVSLYYPSASLLPISTLKIVCKYLKNMFAIKRRKYYTLKSGRDLRLNAGR